MNVSAPLTGLWGERRLLLSSYASAFGAGYMPLLVLPWTYGALVRTGYSQSRAGWIATLEIAALTATSLLLAKRATARRRSWLASSGVLVALVANGIAAAITPSGFVFIAMRIASGAGLGAAVAVGNATAAGSTHPTRAFAFLWFLLGLWQLVVFNATPWAIGHAGLSGAYALIAVSCLIYLPFIARTPDPTVGVRGDTPLTSVPSPLRWVWLLVIVAFLGFWLRDGLLFSMVERLATALGLTGEKLGRILGIASVCSLPGPVLAAWLGNREMSFGLVGAGLFAVLTDSAMTALAQSPSPFVAAVLLGPATMMFATPVLSGLAARVDPTGRLAAIGASVGFFSETLGPAAGGTLMEWGGRNALAVAIVAVGSVTLAAGLLVTLGIRRNPLLGNGTVNAISGIPVAGHPDQ